MPAPFNKHYYRILAVALLWLALPLTSVAQQVDAYDSVAAEATLAEIESKVSAEDVEAAFLTQSRAAVIAEQARADACEAIATEERARLEARFEPLKTIDADVDTTVFDQYVGIKQRLDESIRQQAQCAAVSDHAQALLARISSAQTAISQQFLSSRSETILGAIVQLPRRIATLPEKFRNNDALDLIEGVTPILLFWVLVGGGALAAILGMFIRRRFSVVYEAAGGDAAEPQLRLLFPKPLAEYAPLLFEGITLTAILIAAIENASADLMVVRLAAAIGMYGIGCIVIDWATGPLSPSASVKGLIPDHVKPLRRRLRIFVMTLVASFVVLGTRWLAIRTVAPDVAGRATMILIVALALMYVLAYLRKIPGLMGRFRLIRYAGVLTLVCRPGSAPDRLPQFWRLSHSRCNTNSCRIVLALGIVVERLHVVRLPDQPGHGVCQQHSQKPGHDG